MHNIGKNSLEFSHGKSKSQPYIVHNIGKGNSLENNSIDYLKSRSRKFSHRPSPTYLAVLTGKNWLFLQPVITTGIIRSFPPSRQGRKSQPNFGLIKISLENSVIDYINTRSRKFSHRPSPTYLDVLTGNTDRFFSLSLQRASSDHSPPLGREENRNTIV